MYPIDGPGHDNYRFTAGDPETGQEPTTITPDFLNIQMSELLNILKEAGIEPAKGEENQVAQAIKKISGYDFICHKPDDLEKILSSTRVVDGLRIRVDANQIITKPIVIKNDHVTVESRHMGLSLDEGPVLSEASGFLPDEVNHPFQVEGHYFTLKGFIVNSFKFAVKFAGGLEGGEISKVLVQSPLVDQDLPVFAGKKPKFFIATNNFRSGE